ncbi:MAG: ABC transporter ATP-binding protein [Candidatus Omnitrophica bacterium]|nr:ABC transporter ATP-binding protein [Candidatus Omnitrophota bacterium]
MKRTNDMTKILDVKNLTVSIDDHCVIDHVSFSIDAGRITALVGESGSGKTLTGLAILDLLPEAARKERGEIFFREKNIARLKNAEKREIRGKNIAMVFQEPFTSLNPVMPVGEQIAEIFEAHTEDTKCAIEDKIKNLFNLVKLDPDIFCRYPHELSGGMRQRVMLAMALSCDPDLIIMDEPTTAIDVLIQKEILELIKRLQREKHFAILFITHDFSIVNMIADDISVMKKGRIVEQGTKEEVLHGAKHDYTRRLLDCIPKIGDTRRRLPV